MLSTLQDQFKNITARSSHLTTINNNGWLDNNDADRRNASTQLRNGLANSKLNSVSLQKLPDESEAGENDVPFHQFTQVGNKFAKRSGSVGNRQKHMKSTFSQFYLNNKYKDLLSIQTHTDTIQQVADTMKSQTVAGEL